MELQNFKDKYMVKVKGGIYKPSFEDIEKIVFDIEVSKYLVTKKDVVRCNGNHFFRS